MKYLVIYRKHGDLNIDTQYYIYPTYEEAMEKLEQLPAVGNTDTGQANGCKCIAEIKN